MDQHSDISFILPATDETYSLTQTVHQIQELIGARAIQFIIVTSPTFTTPACRRTIQTLSEAFGSVETFDQTRPGLGGAIQDAFDRAHAEITVLMASDLETDPLVLPALIAKIDEGYDIAATTRWRRGAGFSGYNPVKLIFNFLFQHFFRLLYWTDLTDLTYAYRAYRTPIIKTILWEEHKFPFLFESIVKPLRLGYRVAEVEAPWVARTEGVSHNNLQQTIDYFRVGLRVRFMAKKRLLIHPVRQNSAYRKR